MENLGINGSLLLIQLFNFLILLFVLNKLMYKPILEMLEKRKKKIAEGLRLTTDLTEERQKLEEKKAQVTQVARKEAREILEEAKKDGKKAEAEIIAEARKEAEEVLNKAQKEIEARKQALEANMAKEVINLSLIVAEKVVGEVLDSEKERKLMEKRIQELAKQKVN